MWDRLEARAPIQRIPRSRRLSDSRHLIERANAVSVFDVLRDYFDIVHPREGGGSYKGYCPFGFEHADGGIEKQWRTYPSTNSSYCFAGHGSLTPVRLVQIKKDIKATDAAVDILRRYGLFAPRHFRERYADLVREREEKTRQLGSPAYLVEALRTAAGEGAEDPEAMERVLQRLDEVLADDPTEATVREWFYWARRELDGQAGEGS